MNTINDDKLGMSLDEIIQLNRKKRNRATGSIKSTGTQRSRGRRGGRGAWNNQVFYRNQSNSYRRGNFFRSGQSPLLKRSGSLASLASSQRNFQYTARNYGSGNNRGRFRHSGQQLARNRVRLAAQLLNTRNQRYRGQGRQYGNYRNYRASSVYRDSRRSPYRFSRGFRSNFNMTNSFRSDQLARLRKSQAIQQKFNRVKSLASDVFKNNTSSFSTGSSDTITVYIPNDVSSKRGGRRKRSTALNRSGRFRGSFGRQRNNSYLSYQSLASLDYQNGKDDSANRVEMSPEGSIVTTISQLNRSPSVGRRRNRRARSLPRDGLTRQNIELVTWPIESAQESYVQKVHVDSQQPSTSTREFVPVVNGSPSNVDLSDFKPLAAHTGMTLHERFTLPAV